MSLDGRREDRGLSAGTPAFCAFGTARRDGTRLAPVKLPSLTHQPPSITPQPTSCV